MGDMSLQVMDDSILLLRLILPEVVNLLQALPLRGLDIKGVNGISQRFRLINQLGFQVGNARGLFSEANL